MRNQVSAALDQLILTAFLKENRVICRNILVTDQGRFPAEVGATEDDLIGETVAITKYSEASVQVVALPDKEEIE